MFKKKTFSPILLSFFLFAPAIHADDLLRPPIASNVQAYSSVQNVNVRTLRVGDRSENQALVQVTGVDHDWNNVIQKMTVEKTFKDVRYSVTLNGKPFVAVILNQGFGELHLPGEPTPQHIAFNSALASEANAEHFLSAYLEQDAIPQPAQ